MKPFSIYFPQFYPTPTNNIAWGEGFTDWALVANSNLRNSWSRRAPKRGYYDGASADVHRAQIAEMRAHGMGGFALYHYWFFSHQELDAFETTVLEHESGMPWFMIWATEGWSKRWIGDATTLVRLEEQPSLAQIDEHADHLAKCMGHPDYVFIDGRPVFVIYNLAHFSDPETLITQYRAALKKRGFDVCIGHFVKNPFDRKYASLVDFNYLFEPRLFFGMNRTARGGMAKRLHDIIRRYLGEKVVARAMLLLDRAQQRGNVNPASAFLHYLSSAERRELVKSFTGPVQDVLSPGWNNTPRYSERFTSLESLDPDDFAKLVSDAAMRCPTLPPLVNAWNEWSEGAAIEPCAYMGTRYLDAMNRNVKHVAVEPNTSASG